MKYQAMPFTKKGAEILILNQMVTSVDAENSGELICPNVLLFSLSIIERNAEHLLPLFGHERSSIVHNDIK